MSRKLLRVAVKCRAALSTLKQRSVNSENYIAIHAIRSKQASLEPTFSGGALIRPDCAGLYGFADSSRRTVLLRAKRSGQLMRTNAGIHPYIAALMAAFSGSGEKQDSRHSAPTCCFAQSSRAELSCQERFEQNGTCLIE